MQGVVAGENPSSARLRRRQPINPGACFATVCHCHNRFLALELIRRQPRGLKSFESVENLEGRSGLWQPIQLAMDILSVARAFASTGIISETVEPTLYVPCAQEPRAESSKQSVRAESLAQCAVDKQARARVAPRWARQIHFNVLHFTADKTGFRCN